jgi:hypothetical protein
MELLKTVAAARYRNCSEWQFRRVAKAGQIPFICTGEHTSACRFLKSDLDAYIAAHRVLAKEEVAASWGQ